MKVDKSEVDRRVEYFKQAARRAGVKLTYQRLEIFREVSSRLDHPDAETVFQAVHARLPMVSLDTVYRTLWMLNDLELLNALGPRHESVRFDANLKSHHHFVCVRCGMARDFVSAQLGGLRVPKEAKQFGQATDIHVEVRGICDKCAIKKGESSKNKNNRNRKTEKGENHDR
jgi:Fur family peroxide stress response transcriptional regulator